MTPRAEDRAIPADAYAAGAGGTLRPLVGNLDLTSGVVPSEFVRFRGFAVENGRIWTVGINAEMTFVLPSVGRNHWMLTFDVQAFTWPGAVERQSVQVSCNGQVLADWEFLDRLRTKRGLLLPPDLAADQEVTIRLKIPGCARPAAFGINADQRELGIALMALELFAPDDVGAAMVRAEQFGRRVGPESRKSFDRKVRSGFWSRYITGPSVLDIGFRGGGPGQAAAVPIVEGAIGVDMDYPGYDGKTLPFETNSQDAVYSSHCLEHIPHYVKAIQEWHRVTKVGGHIITVVPHSFLYERKRTPPSRWNADHQRFYTPSSLLMEFERSLLPNTFRVRHLAENDEGYAYSLSPDEHPFGCYEIELVIEKIDPPSWCLGD